MSASAGHGDVAGVTLHGADAGDLVAGRRDDQPVRTAGEGEADVGGPGADDDVPGDGQVAGPAARPGDRDVDVTGARRFAEVVGDLVAGDRRADVALDDAGYPVPGARVLAGAEILDVVIGDRGAVEPDGVDGVTGVAVQIDRKSTRL